MTGAKTRREEDCSAGRHRFVAPSLWWVKKRGRHGDVKVWKKGGHCQDCGEWKHRQLPWRQLVHPRGIRWSSNAEFVSPMLIAAEGSRSNDVLERTGQGSEK